MKIPCWFLFFAVGLLLAPLHGNGELVPSAPTAAPAIVPAPSLDSPNAAERVLAIAQITDQSVLAKAAIEDKDTDVRKAAVKKLTDQALLVKVALESSAPFTTQNMMNGDQPQPATVMLQPNSQYDPLIANLAVQKLTDQALLAKLAARVAEFGVADFDIRKAAVENLTDQALLAKIAVESDNSDIRKASIAKLTDQAVLARIAVQDKDEYVRPAAVSKLTDQALLDKIAVEDYNGLVRVAAVEKLIDQSLLAELISDTEAPLESRHLAIAKILTKTSVDFEKLNGEHLSNSTTDALKAWGGMRIAITNPIIASRMPNIILNVSVEPSYINWGERVHMYGEQVTFTLKRGAGVLITEQWATKFPSGITYIPGVMREEFLSADVDVSGMMAKLFNMAALSQEDFGKLSQSEVPEIRAGALANLVDQAVLSTIAVTNKNLDARRAAVAKLMDQVLLAKIAMEDKDEGIREAAAEKLTDQTLLAKIAVESNDNDLRKDALSRLTDQNLLDEIATTKDAEVRKAAVFSLRDQASLAKIAVENNDNVIRGYAVYRLTEQTLLAKIAVEDKNGSVRQTAVAKLTDQILLAKIADEDKDIFVCNAAKNRLDALHAGKP